MSALVPIAYAGWFLLVLILFTVLPGRHAVVTGFLIAWLFLPVTAYGIKGLPDFSKMLATNLGVLGAIALCDRRRLNALRPRWIDLPMIVWCLCPFASSMSNGLGAYDGLSAVFAHCTTWGVPYAIGRMYYASLPSLRSLAMGVLIGGLLYVPLCWIEIQIGPQLHRALYGYAPRPIWQAMRFGGWRPTVFMQHGLMVGFWMAAASLTGAWLWATGSLHRGAGIAAAALALTTVLVKSVNAWVLLALGGGVLWSIRRYRTAWPLWCVIALVPLYVLIRSMGWWNGEQLGPLVTSVLGTERGESVAFRLARERIVAERARQRPLVGWGGWGRARFYGPNGEAVAILDSTWILAFGNSGFLGLLSFLAALLLPVVVFCRRYPIQQWADPGVAAAAVLALVVALYAVDNCFNAMVNPIYMLAAGGLAGAAAVDDDVSIAVVQESR